MKLIEAKLKNGKKLRDSSDYIFLVQEGYMSLGYNIVHHYKGAPLILTLLVEVKESIKTSRSKRLLT